MQRVIYLIFQLLIISNCFGEYKAVVIGEPRYMAYAKKELQAHISRESHFCRGANFAEMKTSPSCQISGPSEETCKITFDCARVMPGKTRLTNMAKYPLSDVGLNSLRRMNVVVGGKEVTFKKNEVFVDASKSNEMTEVDVVTQDDEDDQKINYKEEIKTTTYENFSDLEKLVEDQDYGEVRLEVDSPLVDEIGMDINQASSEEDILEEELAALTGEEKSEKSKVKLSVEEEVPVTKLSESKTVKKKYKKRIAKQKGRLNEVEHGFFLLGLSYSLISTGSETGSVAQSADIAWSPVLKLSQNWAVRGNLGYHNLKAFISDTGFEESFSVYDFGLNVEKSILDMAYIDFGLGLQQWGSTVGGTFTTINFGAGYRFHDSVLWLIDQLFLNYSMISNSDANKEIRFGLRSYF